MTRQRIANFPSAATRADSSPYVPSENLFPLSVSSSGRYLQTASGAPFLAAGDTPWSLAVNCSDAQIDSYLADRAAKGCTAILFNAVERGYSSQTPIYRNASGNDPFTVMSPVNWTLNNAYWNRVDYIVNSAKALGIVCFIAPAYTGYGSGSDGWLGDYSGVSDATLQAYGAALASRYTQGNVVWVLGGDDANDVEAAGNYGSGTTPNRTKQWQIVIGIRSVRTTDLVTGHTARNTTGAVSGEAYKAWTTGYTGFNLNNCYGLDDVTDMIGLANTAYGRAGPMPFFMIEAGYQDTDGSDPGGIIPATQAVLSGALAGYFGGHDALWHMGSYTPNTGAAAVLSTYLASSWTSYGNLAALLRSKAWHLLEPKKDTSLVTVAPGTGNVLCPARASDGSFALVFAPNTSSFTVNMNQLTPSSVRGRWFNWTDGSYANATGTPFANTGTQTFTPPASNRILVLDAA